MASEIRANKQTNRVGLGTVTYTDTGIIVSGIVTANSLGGIGHINVGNNIKLGNEGVITATSFVGSGANLTGIDATAIKDTSGNVKIQAQASGAMHTGIHTFQVTSVSEKITIGTGNTLSAVGNATFTGIVTASSFSGDGSSLSNLPAGAPVGGASTNTVFFETDTAVAVNYQITTNKNAMSAGPIAINAGIAVTVPSGSSWTIV